MKQSLPPLVLTPRHRIHYVYAELRIWAARRNESGKFRNEVVDLSLDETLTPSIWGFDYARQLKSLYRFHDDKGDLICESLLCQDQMIWTDSHSGQTAVIIAEVSNSPRLHSRHRGFGDPA